MTTIPEQPGVDFAFEPKMSQSEIDARLPDGPGRTQYRLANPGAVRIADTTITGPQLGGTVPSQTFYAASAAVSDLVSSGVLEAV